MCLTAQNGGFWPGRSRGAADRGGGHARGLRHARGAATAGYLSAFPPREFEEVEKLCDPPPPGGCRAWVPHYAVHKLLAGLLAMHEAIGRAAAGALPLVLGMADYLWRRAAAARL